MKTTTRRTFLNQLGTSAAGLGISAMLPQSLFSMPLSKPFHFKISLAEFSFASELYTGKMTNMDFPARAKEVHDIDALEYVSGFFNGKHTDAAYMKELKQRCEDLGMVNHLIMVDGANIASLDTGVRNAAVESHYEWVEAAKFLGCSSIRVNLGDPMAVLMGKGEEGSPEQIAEAALDGYGKLLDFAARENMNVIVENHFGLSTNPDWLLGIMEQLEQQNKGFLPDFGNFCEDRTAAKSMEFKDLLSTKCLKEFDKYEGVAKMMPYTKGISAKTHIFDEDGYDLETDFFRMFKIIKDSGWTGGYVGIEYEGGLMRDMGGDMKYLSNDDGIRATKLLLEEVLEKFGSSQ